MFFSCNTKNYDFYKIFVIVKVSNFEDIRKSLEEQIAKSQRTSVNSEINSIKTKLDAEEVRLLKLASFSKSNRSSAEPPYSRFSFRTNNTDELVNEFVNQTNNAPFASPADQQQTKLKGYSVFLNNDNFLNRKLSVTGNSINNKTILFSYVSHLFDE